MEANKNKLGNNDNRNYCKPIGNVKMESKYI